MAMHTAPMSSAAKAAPNPALAGPLANGGVAAWFTLRKWCDAFANYRSAAAGRGW
jgi:hypothetical protein